MEWTIYIEEKSDGWHVWLDIGTLSDIPQDVLATNDFSDFDSWEEAYDFALAWATGGRTKLNVRCDIVTLREKGED